MIKLFQGLLSILLSTTICAQSVKFDWVKSMGGTNQEFGLSSNLDDPGNIYTTGGYEGIVDFDPDTGTLNLNSIGGRDIFIQKLDNNGNFIWAKSIGGIGQDGGYSIVPDQNGNVFVTGFFKDTVDFDPGIDTFYLITNSSASSFILKLDSSGNFIWAKSFGGSDTDVSVSMAIDNFSNVYVTGHFEGTADFNPDTSTFYIASKGDEDIFILKLDSNGNFVWANSIGGTSRDEGRAIIIDVSGNVYVSGRYRLSADFDPDTSSFIMSALGLYDIFILKLDEDGKFIWSQSVEGNFYNWGGHCISADSYGNLYLTGTFKDTVDFDNGPGINKLSSNGSADAFILKTDSNGSFIWARSIGGSTVDFGISVTNDILGNVYLTGTFKGLVDFNPGSSKFYMTSRKYTNSFSYSPDVYFIKLDGNGNWIWSKSFGGDGADASRSIRTDSYGNIFVYGVFDRTSDFDPSIDSFNITSNGSYDVFLEKLTPCMTNSGVEVIRACDSFTWIDGVTYLFSDSSSFFALTNSTGCDSIINLHLTIDTVDVSVFSSDPVITALAVGARYQWLDCNNNYAVIQDDTLPNFTASINGKYAVEVSQNGCTDTSKCVTISTIGIEESTLFTGVSIFPNPNDGIINIGLGNLNEVSIKVFSDKGEMIYQKENITVESYQFELNAGVGVYIIELSSQGEKQQYKLVKQ